MAEKNPEKNEEQNVPAVPEDGVAAQNPLDARTYLAFASERQMERVTRAMESNLKGQNLTERDFPRVTVPAQGNTIWTIPSSEGDQHQEEIVGILVDYTTPRAYWEKELDPGNIVPPDCSSPDGIKGVGAPGGDCLTCPFNQFDSATGENRHGKACKEKRMLFILQPDSILPLVVQAPSTSIKPVRDYTVGLTSQAIPIEEVYTSLKLEKVGQGAMAYSRINFKNMGEIPEELTETVQRYKESFAALRESGTVAEATGVVVDAEEIPGAAEETEAPASAG